MFGFERLWARLRRWMTQKSYPEATMLNAFRAFTKACVALPERMSALQVDMTEPTQSFGIRNTPFYHVPHTFNEDTCELQLPEFMQDPEAMPIKLFDFKKTVILSNRRGTKGNRARWLAELFLFYYNFPQLCRAWLCNAPCNIPTFSTLWDSFLQATDTAMLNKHRLPDALRDWHFWGQDQLEAGLLSRQQVEICYGVQCGPTTLYAILIGPEWSQQCWHQADWRVQRKPVTASSCLRTAPSSLPAESGHFCLTLHQDVIQTLSMRPTLLMISGLRKCPGPMLQLTRACKSLDARSSRGTQLIIPTATYG